MNITSQFELKTFLCRRLETKRRSVRNGDFGFRRKAQVRTNTLFIFIKSVPNAKETPNGSGGKPKPNKSGHSLVPQSAHISPTVSPCLEKASTHLFPTPSPQLSPLLQFGFNCSVCLIYLALFNPFHRRPAHLRSGVYVSSICCSFCLALRWGLAISSVKF